MVVAEVSLKHMSAGCNPLFPTIQHKFAAARRSFGVHNVLGDRGTLAETFFG